MSWKSIEMQVALPRTQDAGKLQDNMTKQGQQFQSELTQQQLEKDKVQQKRVNEFEDVENLKTDVNQDKEDSTSNQSEQGDGQEETVEEQSIEHPYLGSRIDYSR